MLTWAGGEPNQGMVLHVVPAFHQAPGPRPGPGGGRVPGHFMPPPRNAPENAIILKLDTNPGTYTIPAADIQAMLNNSTATHILCGVSQINLTEIPGTNGVIRALLQNGDRVVVEVQ